jgi:antitoxin FitA
MGQIIIRNLDDDLIADYREAAVRHNRSLEAEIRSVLQQLRPRTPLAKAELLAKLAEIREMTPKGVKQTPAEELVREDRDGYRW